MKSGTTAVMAGGLAEGTCSRSEDMLSLLVPNPCTQACEVNPLCASPMQASRVPGAFSELCSLGQVT